MELLKKGSKSNAVMTLQEALNKRGHNLVVDGIFGQKTEDAVVAFQASRYMQCDGIVGPKTWKALGFVVTPEAGDIDIVKGYINTHISYLPRRKVEYIAIHYTAGGSSKPGSALGVRKVFLKRNASADFAVDDRDIVQINPDLKNYYCWSVGDNKNPYTGGGRLYGKATNRNTISIEVCSNLKAGTSASQPNHTGWYFTDEALGNALKLVRHLMTQFGIPKANVVRHYDISGKMCPGILEWNNAYIYTTDGKQTKTRSDSDKWLEFWEKI